MTQTQAHAGAEDTSRIAKGGGDRSEQDGVVARTIVVGVDGTDASEAAVAWAAAYATDAGAKVLALHAVPEPWLWGVAALQIDSDPLIATRRKLLLGRWTEPLRNAGVEISTQLHVGDPTAELLSAARRTDADLIVIGARRHSVLHDLAERGTAHKLPDRSEVPVVLVPAPPPADGPHLHALG